MEERALAALDADAIAADTAALVRIPSLTGDERAAAELVASIAERLGLAATVVEHDLAALRRHPGHPGEEAERMSLFGTIATTPASAPETAAGARGLSASTPRVCLNGHIDVVSAGTAPWSRHPFSGEVSGGFVHGRGSADMKGGVIAALHAAAAVAATGASRCEVVVQAVPSEEDGGLGTFAALEADDRFDAALIPEPTAFAIAAAQAGALTFTGVVPGVSAHAAVRLEGVSAIDRYVEVHRALQDHERVVNTDVAHPLMRRLELPYPLLVGRVAAGEWSSQVPDRLVFEGRVGVRIGETVEEARAALEATVHAACPEAAITWTGGQFAPGATDLEDPFIRTVTEAAAAELGHDPDIIGVPYGSDMRLFTARGIPAVMLGPPGLELAHAVDERVAIADLVTTARAIVRVLCRL